MEFFYGSVVGFDLDNTLYKPNKEINEEIKRLACKLASAKLNIDYLEIRRLFDENYSENNSGSKSLEIIGINNGKELMQSALENIDVNFLKRDRKLVNLIKNIYEEYKLFMITSNKHTTAIRKLDVLGIYSGVFDPLISSESKLNREEGSVFEYIKKKFKVDYKDILFIGDREKTDIIPANRIGIKTAIVNSKSNIANFQLEEIYDLEFILQKINPAKT